MKRILCILLSILTFAVLYSCEDGESMSSSTENSVEDSKEDSVEESSSPTENAKKTINSLDYTNTGKMGDVDGPAFAVYSRTGYNGACVTLDLKNMEINTVLPDGRFVNGYTFLGSDVYTNGYWSNCFDAGLCWSGKNGGWHIFYNVYQPVNEGDGTWYESSKKLPKNGRYVMTLEFIADERARITVKGIDNNFKDSVEIGVKGAKADGSNTSMLFNTALDYPQNTKVDPEGAPCEDWVTITLANSDKGLYLKNFHAYDLKLYKNGSEEEWTDGKNSACSIWPDKSITGFDYAPTEVYLFDGSEYFINLDMNRK